MRPDGVVMAAPGFDQDLGLLQRREDFPAQKFVAQLAVEGLVVAVFPWAAGFDVKCPDTDLTEPFTHRRRDELRPVVGTDVCSGGPCSMKRSASVSSTLPLFKRRSTQMARHVRLNSSMTVSMRSFFPS